MECDGFKFVIIQKNNPGQAEAEILAKYTKKNTCDRPLQKNMYLMNDGIY